MGEGIVAKRRTYASLVSYLTPPFMESRTRGQYKELFDLIARYDRASEVQRQEVALQIKRQVVALGLHHDLQLDSRWPIAWPGSTGRKEKLRRNNIMIMCLYPDTICQIPVSW